MELRLRARTMSFLSGPCRKLSEFPEHRNEKTDGAWARNRRPLFSRFVRSVAPLFQRWESRRRSSKYFHGTTSKARSIKDDTDSPRWNIYSLAANVNLSLSFSFLCEWRTRDVKFSSIYEIQTEETRRKAFYIFIQLVLQEANCLRF